MLKKKQMERAVSYVFLKASKMLRKRTQEFLKTPVEFSGAMAVRHNEIIFRISY